MQWKECINTIKPLNQTIMKQAREYNDNLIKPIGSLGRLEDLAVQIAGITEKIQNSFNKKAIIIMCADNGVYEEGVSTAPQEVTKTQTLNFLKGITGVAVLAKQGNIDLKVVDIGINAEIEHPLIYHKKIAYGTKNITKEPAMTQEQLEKAIEVGFCMVKQLKEEGYQILGTGEMGISNTTTAESVIIALTGCNVEEAVGKGAGLTEELYQRKKEVIQKALLQNSPNPKNALDVVKKVGGFDIAGLLGCFIGAAYFKIPIIIDGVISIAAALAAYCLNPLIKDYMIPSHFSEEAGYKIAAETIGIKPYFCFNMRLGEGSGCPFTFYITEAATRIMRDMVSFEEGNVDKSNYIDIREQLEENNRRI